MAYALLSSAKGSSSSSPATTNNLDSSGAKLLIVFVSTWVVNPATTISDSQLNNWTALGTFADPGGGAQLTVYYAAAPINTSTTHSFSAASSGTIFTSLVASAWSGAATSLPFDAETGSVSNSYDNTNAFPGNLTPGANNELLVSGFCFGTANTMSIGSSFNLIDQVNFVGGTNFGVAAAYKIQTIATLENPQWTMTAPPANGGIDLAAFKAASTGRIGGNRLLMGVGT